MNYSETRNGIECLLIDGKLTITPKRKQAGQIQLSAEDIEWLLDFLASMGVIAGYVKHVPLTNYSNAPVYRLRIKDPARLNAKVEVDLVVHKGEIECIDEVGGFDWHEGEEEWNPNVALPDENTAEDDRKPG